MSKDRPANKFELKGIDDIFGKDFKNSDEDVFNEADEHTSNDSMEVEIELLQPFKIIRSRLLMMNIWMNW